MVVYGCVLFAVVSSKPNMLSTSLPSDFADDNGLQLAISQRCLDMLMNIFV